jgi:predicted dehydrogenase/threonine dehydrogenase-like Zn-dependent dehydrogenase
VALKQVAQRPRDGEIRVVDSPPPALRSGWLLVANRYSLISAGTERTKIAMGEKNILQKARARPDLVKKFIDRARVEGAGAALGVARDRLAALAPIGYSSAGVVLEVGSGVDGLAPGDRVACGGGGWANHAEIVAVPRNLAVPVPEGVGLDAAAYTTVGAVALHGVRQSGAAIGESVGVIGLGLVGQLAVRICRAAGCHVVGIDLDSAATELARRAGALALDRNEPGLEERVRAATDDFGLDLVLLCAASASSDPLELAVRLARDRGRIVVVGETPISVDRALMYEKELEVRMSRSYGPGRYDRDYEERGHDLPPGYVRWTEQRNMQAFLDLVGGSHILPDELTTHRFPVESAAEAYRELVSSDKGRRPFGVLLEYTEATVDRAPRVTVDRAPRVTRTRAVAQHTPGVALIGAGAFARATLIPALKGAGAPLVAVASEGGLTAADVAARFGFAGAANSAEKIFEDPTIGAIVIATRHASHASLASAALRMGKSVFVEKPLALAPEQLHEVEEAIDDDSLLMVGFNRRFAPLVERLESELGDRDDLVITMRVNAGPLASDHWLHDPADGGGRLLGEACHFIDLIATLADSPALSAHALAVPQPGRPIECSDSFTIHIRFAAAVATLAYSGSGDTRLPKERLELFGGGVAAVLDDFRTLEVYRGGKRRSWKSTQDKGHRAEIARFLAATRGEGELPSPGSYIDSTALTLALAESLRTGTAIDISARSRHEAVS